MFDIYQYFQYLKKKKYDGIRVRAFKESYYKFFEAEVTFVFTFVSLINNLSITDAVSPCISAKIDINYWNSNGWHTDSIIQRKHGYGIAMLCDLLRHCRISLVVLRVSESKKTLPYPFFSLSRSRDSYNLFSYKTPRPFAVMLALVTNRDRSFNNYHVFIIATE